MFTMRTLAALVLACASPLLADEPAAKSPKNAEPDVHVIQPPDVLSIEMLKLKPLPSYRAGVFDVLQIRANALPDQPIDGYFMVEAEGMINLGPTYGAVRVAGMTIEETRAVLHKRLRQWLKDSAVTVQLARSVSGQYTVGPDGTISLLQYGAVQIAGKTVKEARIAIQNHLTQYLDSPELSMDVAAHDSHASAKRDVYLLITRRPGPSSVHVKCLPVAGQENVFDAVGHVEGVSSKVIRSVSVVRRNAGDKPPTILPVDWKGIVEKADTATNYELRSTDAVYVETSDPEPMQILGNGCRSRSGF